MFKISIIKIWVGSKDGMISVFCSETFECEKSFDAHKDTIKSLCILKIQGYIISG